MVNVQTVVHESFSITGLTRDQLDRVIALIGSCAINAELDLFDNLHNFAETEYRVVGPVGEHIPALHFQVAASNGF